MQKSQLETFLDNGHLLNNEVVFFCDFPCLAARNGILIAKLSGTLNFNNLLIKTMLLLEFQEVKSLKLI